MKRSRPSLGSRLAGVMLCLTALSLLIPPVFATALHQVQRPEQLPANFQNLPGPHAAVSIPTELFDPDPNHVRMQFSDPPLEMGSVTFNGDDYQTVKLSGEGATLEPGMPDIPRVTRLIMIANTGNVTPVILDQSYTVMDNVLPPPMQPLDGDEGKTADVVIPPVESVYQTDAWYPQDVVTLSEPATFRDVRFVVLTVYPVQVNPVTRQMRVYDNVEVEVQNAGGIGENEIYVHPTSISPSFKSMYRTFENFEGSPLDALPVFPGNYLVICQNNGTVITEAQRLVDWYKRKGLDASYVALTSPTYSTIQSTIVNQYNSSNGQLEFVCLLGDPGASNPYYMPTRSTGISGQYDNYYSLMAGGPNPDPVPDIAIGRIPATSGTALTGSVTKIINYESSPADTVDSGWFTRAWCAAHTQYIASNPSTKEYTRQIMLQHGVATVYWNVYSGSVSETDIDNRLATGISVFNHRMSWIGETPSSALDAFPTNGKLPFVMSVTCGTGDFESSSPDISELWFLPSNQTPTSPKGAIGCVGVATSSTHVPYNNIIDAGVMYGFYALDVAEQGNALVYGKLQLYKNYWGFHSTETTEFSNWTNLMGDPATPVWRKTPEHVTVAGPSTISRGTNNISLTVTRTAGGDPVDGALVCLLKGNETFSRGYTLDDGTINLPCSTATTGYLQVTITKDDIKPYLDSIQVTNAAAFLSFNGRTIDDDNSGGTIGDNNHVLNPGETIDLTINLTNSGTSNTITGISSTLVTSSPGIQITQASSTYPNLSPGANANDATPFRFNVSSVFNNEPVTFFLNLTSSIGSGTVRVDLTPTAGDVTYLSSTFSGPGGNIDPGESGNLVVTYRNSGSRSLLSSTGRVRSLDQFITVTDSVGTFGTVTPSSTINNAGDPFAISVSSGAYNGHVASMQMVITDANGFRDSTDFTLNIGTQTSTSPTGPDAYGYFAYDNTETTPPNGASTYEWLELYGNGGTSLNFSDQSEDGDQSTVLNLPFTFTFYGQSFTQITVCTNGWLSMGATTIDDFRNYRMGTPLGPPNQVAAYWDDLKAYGSANNVYWKYDPTQHWYVVEWRAYTLWTNVPETFQIILYDPAYYPSATGDGKIKFQYQTVNLSANSGANDNDYASVGIQDADHSIGLDYYYWNQYSPGSGTLVSGRSIMITTDGNGQLNPGITVNTPNGGESWYIGQPYNILWASTAISGNVNVSLNRNYPGGGWESLFSNTADDGVQQWAVTGSSTTNNARIRVISVSQPSVGDTSDANFTLQLPSVSIITPNGGEALVIGTQAYMQWTANGVGASTLALNRNYPGGSWEVLSANAGSDFLWNVTGPPASNVRIRVISNALPSIGDTSDANFSIGAPPLLQHDRHPDQTPGTATFVAHVTDDLPGFTTKLFYRLFGATYYDSLALTATGNPDEYAVTTPSLASGAYQYYLRSTDTQDLSAFSPVSGAYKLDIGPLGEDWIGCDDGTAENYNWVNGPGFKWAVKFVPTSFPFALSGARFAICPTCPTPQHDAVIVKVYLADGPNGFPGTVVYTDTTGPAGNIIGGLPTGAAWADVVIRVNGQSLILNDAFYVSVQNSSPRVFPVAFALDTNSVRCHMSYFWDECEQTWYSEDDASDNARPGNRMISANGFALAPPVVVVHRSANSVVVDWESTGAPYYRLYFATNPDGPFDSLLGSTASNTFTDTDAVNLNIKRFYQVVSTDTP